MNEKVILDCCCSGRMFWFDKLHPHTVYTDIRSVPVGSLPGKSFCIEPDLVVGLVPAEHLVDQRQ